MHLQRERFEELVEEALRDLPEEFKTIIENLAFIVEDFPSRETLERTGTPASSTLLGLYTGVPYSQRGPYYGNVPPDVILLFQLPIERACTTEKDIKNRIAEVVRHEIAHYFGFNEVEVRRMERGHPTKKPHEEEE